MTTTNPTNRNIQKASVSQNDRDQNARQLRSDFLASMFSALCNKIHGVFTYSVVKLRVRTQA